MRLLSTLMLCVATANASGSVSDCSSPMALFNITSLKYLPDTTLTGKNSSLRISMDVPEVIYNGTASYEYQYNFMPFSPKPELLCSRINCPILPGKVTATLQYPVPRYLSGNLKIKITWKDQKKQELLCMIIRMSSGSAAKQLIEYRTKPFLPLPTCPTYMNHSFLEALKDAKHVQFKKPTYSKKLNKLRGNA